MGALKGTDQQQHGIFNDESRDRDIHPVRSILQVGIPTGYSMLYLTTALAALRSQHISLYTSSQLQLTRSALLSASSTLVTEPGRYTDDDILTATEPGEHSVVRVSCVEMC